MADEPLQRDLADLLDSERRAPRDPGARQRVAARLASTLGALPVTRGNLPSAGRAWPASHLAAVGAAFVLGTIAGAAGLLLLRPGAPVPTPVPPPPMTFAPEPPAPARQPGPLEIPSAIPSSDPAAAARPIAPASTLALEQMVLDPARVALGRDDPGSALAAAETHARRFPRGELSEEREAIAIQALVLLHREGPARVRARAFLRAYPGSALLPAVREALGNADGGTP